MARVAAGSRGPSMMDVARLAGVSIATVSNVVNSKGRVAADTADRVRHAVAVLGFVRNDAARLLATGSTDSIGMVLADLDNSLFVDMAHGAQQGSDANDMRLLLGNSACALDRQDDYLRLFDEARVAGVLLAPMEDSLAGIERMRAHGRPIVLLNYEQEGADCCTVLTDNHRVGYLAAKHLIEIGRQRLAFIASKDYYQPVHDRREGVRQAVAEADEVTLEEIDSGGLRFEHGLAAAAQFDERGEAGRPDGVIAVTDEIGNGLAAGLHTDLTARVPEDVAIIGCEDNRSAQNGPVMLTTVHLSGVDMGQAATELLLEELGNERGHKHRHVIVQPRLVIRASTLSSHVLA